MAFANETNRGRVQRMVDFLDLIEASATSNKTAELDVAEMLAPILLRMQRYYRHALTVPQPEEAPAPTAAPPKPGSHASWQTIRQMAEEAPIADLQVAMAVFLSRLDEILARA